MAGAPKALYRIRVRLDPQPEGGWTITSPDMPGLVTEADLPEEIEPNVQDAFQALMESYRDSPADLPDALRPLPDAPFTIDTVVAAG